MVRERAEPVGRDEAAAAAGVGRALAVYHLDKLVEAGLLTASYQRPPGRGGPGAGRPAKLYTRSDREFAVTVPPREYQLAARLLVQAVESDPSGQIQAVLLEAARRCIVRRGSARIRMAEVAEEAGVARSTVYRYFPGTEALLLATAMRSGDGFLEQLAEHLRGETDPVSAMVEWWPSRSRTSPKMTGLASCSPKKPRRSHPFDHFRYRIGIQPLDAAPIRRGLGSKRFRRRRFG